MHSNDIDVLEDNLRVQGNLLNILLLDRTKSTNNKTLNIIWATDSYFVSQNNPVFAPKAELKPELVTGAIYGKLIQPRSAKPLAEQKKRTKDKAEVFTPLKIVKEMNMATDRASNNWPVRQDNWVEYISEKRLEITCGEAPFIVSRYDPTASRGVEHELYNNKGKLNRVGFLDRKLDIVTKFCKSQKDWIFWAKQAYMASYGYEWQGDNLLIARENLLYTFIEFYNYKFGKKPSVKLQESIAEIVSWNIFQMDGLKYVIPMSCEGKTTPKKHKQTSLLPEEGELHEQIAICEGCAMGDVFRHSGNYVLIKDWQTNKPARFVDLLKNN